MQAHLRQSILNRIRNELKEVDCRPATTDLDSELADSAQSPHEAAIGAEATERYDAGARTVCPTRERATTPRTV